MAPGRKACVAFGGADLLLKQEGSKERAVRVLPSFQKATRYFVRGKLFILSRNKSCITLAVDTNELSSLIYACIIYTLKRETAEYE